MHLILKRIIKCIQASHLLIFVLCRWRVDLGFRLERNSSAVSYSFMTLRGVVSVTERVSYCLPRVIIILNKNLRLVVNLKLRRLSERMRNKLLPPGYYYNNNNTQSDERMFRVDIRMYIIPSTIYIQGQKGFKQTERTSEFKKTKKNIL